MRITNALLVRWAGGYTTVTNDDSITAYGRREDFLSAGDAQSTHEAERLALGLLARLAWPSEAITVAIEPTGTDDVPYVDFAPGDNVTAPNAAGIPQSWRVKGITVTEDDEGHPIYVPELVIDESGS